MCRGTGDACAPVLKGKLKLQKKEQDGEQNERKKKKQQQEQKRGKANKAGLLPPPLPYKGHGRANPRVGQANRFSSSLARH